MTTTFSKTRVKDKNKKEVNNILGEFIEDYPQFKKGYALILDSPHLLTTNTLANKSYIKSKIVIPNPFEYAKIRAKHPKTYNELLGNFIESKGVKNSISFAFFDYMCSVDGNTDIEPMIDIERYFEKQMPMNDSLFAVTLSFRGRRRIIDDTREYSAINKADHIITKCAYLNGYTAIKYPCGFAYNGMFFTIYRIIKK